MTSATRRSPIGLALGASLTLLVLVAGAPRSADAEGCAHPHVTIGADAHGPAVAGLDLLADLGVVPRGSPDRPAETPDIPRPCSGPGCSKGQGVPLAPSSASEPPRVEPWGLLIARRPEPDPKAQPLPPSPEAPRTAPLGPSVFHPPR